MFETFLDCLGDTDGGKESVVFPNLYVPCFRIATSLLQNSFMFTDSNLMQMQKFETKFAHHIETKL